MRIFRFMSKEEFIKYKNGEELYNNTRHQAKTNSIGFCFFNTEDVEPELAWRFMKGAIFPDLCAVFEVDENKLNRTYGIYNDPNKTLYEIMNFIIKPIKVTEYCTKQYNNKIFKLLKVTSNKLNIFENYESFKWKVEV